MIDPKPYRIGALSWYHDSKVGERTHAWAEKPCPAPAILCESVEQADELLAARERCEELEKALRRIGRDEQCCANEAGEWARAALAPRGDKEKG